MNRTIQIIKSTKTFIWLIAADVSWRCSGLWRPHRLSTRRIFHPKKSGGL